MTLVSLELSHTHLMIETCRPDPWHAYSVTNTNHNSTIQDLAPKAPKAPKAEGTSDGEGHSVKHYATAAVLTAVIAVVAMVMWSLYQHRTSPSIWWRLIWLVISTTTFVFTFLFIVVGHVPERALSGPEAGPREHEPVSERLSLLLFPASILSTCSPHLASQVCVFIDRLLAKLVCFLVQKPTILGYHWKVR